jgi:hypothetical protein
LFPDLPAAACQPALLQGFNTIMENTRHSSRARLIAADMVAFVTLAVALGLATGIALAGVALLLASQGSL